MTSSFVIIIIILKFASLERGYEPEKLNVVSVPLDTVEGMAIQIVGASQVCRFSALYERWNSHRNLVQALKI